MEAGLTGRFVRGFPDEAHRAQAAAVHAVAGDQPDGAASGQLELGDGLEGHDIGRQHDVDFGQVLLSQVDPDLELLAE